MAHRDLLIPAEEMNRLLLQIGLESARIRTDDTGFIRDRVALDGETFEIGLMHHFVLLLGHQSYSVTVVLFGLLVGASIGSMLSERFPLGRRSLIGAALDRAQRLRSRMTLRSVTR